VSNRVCGCAGQCTDADKLHKAVAVLYQGFLGCFGAGGIYTGHIGFSIASLAVTSLVGLALIVRTFLPGIRSEGEEKTDEEKIRLRLTTDPDEVKQSRANSEMIFSILLWTGVSISAILWLVGLVAIMADWMLPSNGCGWAFAAK
jgi:hypothetical protein